MIIIALGANLPSEYGTPRQTLDAVVNVLPEYGIFVSRKSPWYETEPVPKSDQPNYVNGIAIVETDKTAEDMLATLHMIEADFGRQRTVVNAARCIDLDLIDYKGQCTEGDMVLPHPRMHQRGFVLYPLRDVAPDWCHPVMRKSVQSLIDDLPEDQIIA